jgi:hypothetical protein
MFLMGFQVKKAERKKIFTKVALMGASGGGKTFSSLRLAKGMAAEIERQTGKKAKILLANTELERGYYYANEFDYDIVDIEPPHEPETYVNLIEFAVKEGYDILIIDSSSHEWEGKGGCLEIQQKLGGRYQDWGKVTPRHDRFINAIAESQIHIIATMRGKDQYVMNQDDKNNRTKVEKVGVGAKQRDGFEYEFTCTFLLDQKTNTAEPFKDNTHIFENEPAVKLTEEHGKKIIQWANTSKLEPEKKKVTTPAPASSSAPVDSVTEGETLESVIKDIDNKARSLSTSGIDKGTIADAIKKHHKNANYNSIKDIEVAKNVLNELNGLEG